MVEAWAREGDAEGPACAVGECIATRLAASAAYNFLEFERTPHKQGRGIWCGSAMECGQSRDAHPRRGFMEFWIGLSVGMHLGKVIAEYLEKFVEAFGLLDVASEEKAKAKIERRAEIGEIVEELVE
jgi:hypothetical protein